MGVIIILSVDGNFLEGVLDVAPLPAALPLFGSGVLALAGLAAVRRKGKVW